MAKEFYKISKKDVLLIIDMQNDFCPDGALAVDNGDEIIKVINKLSFKFDKVIMSQDWHPENHKSFASNHANHNPFDVVDMPYGKQILWPDHCIADSHGAEFNAKLDIKNVVMIIRKGYHPEIDSYSAFYENDKITATGLDGFLRDNNIKRIFIVGLATDFCVGFSAIDAANLGYDVVVVDDATKAIDMNGSLNNIYSKMKKNNVKRCLSIDLK